MMAETIKSRMLTFVVTGLAFVLLNVPLLYVDEAAARVYAGPREALVVVLSWILILLSAVTRAWTGRPIWTGGQGSWARRLMFAFGVWMAATGLWAHNPTVVLMHMGTIVTYLLLAQSVLDWFGDRPGHQRALFIAVGITICVQSLFAFAEYLQLPLSNWAANIPRNHLGEISFPGGYWLFDLLASTGFNADEKRPAGTLYNQNYFAEMLVLTLPVLMCWAMGARERVLRILGMVSLALPLGMLVATGTRAALLGLIVAAPIAALIVLGRRALNPKFWISTRSAKVAALAVTVIFVGLIAILGGRLGEKFQQLGHDRAIEARLVNWRIAVDVWREQPVLGVGLGNYKLLNTEKQRQVLTNGAPEIVANERFIRVHNEPLQALVEFGIVGILLLLCLGFVWIKETAYNTYLSPNLRFGVIWGIGAVSVASLFGFPLHVPTTALLIIMFLAFGITHPADKDHVVNVAPAWRPVYASIMFAALVFVGGLTLKKIHIPMFLASHYEYQAKSLLEAGRMQGAEVAYNLAQRLAPFKGELKYYQLATIVNQERYADALTFIEASKKDGLGVEAYFWKARALYGVGRLHEAREAYQIVLTFFPENHNLHKGALEDLKLMDRGAAGEKKSS